MCDKEHVHPQHAEGVQIHRVFIVDPENHMQHSRRYPCSIPTSTSMSIVYIQCLLLFLLICYGVSIPSIKSSYMEHRINCFRLRDLFTRTFSVSSKRSANDEVQRQTDSRPANVNINSVEDTYDQPDNPLSPVENSQHVSNNDEGDKENVSANDERDNESFPANEYQHQYATRAQVQHLSEYLGELRDLINAKFDYLFDRDADQVEETHGYILESIYHFLSLHQLPDLTLMYIFHTTRGTSSKFYL